MRPSIVIEETEWDENLSLEIEFSAEAKTVENVTSKKRPGSPSAKKKPNKKMISSDFIKTPVFNTIKCKTTGQTSA